MDAVPPVLDVVVRSTGEEALEFGPLEIAQRSHEKKELLILKGPSQTIDVGIQDVDPPRATLPPGLSWNRLREAIPLVMFGMIARGHDPAQRVILFRGPDHRRQSESKKTFVFTLFYFIARVPLNFGFHRGGRWRSTQRCWHSGSVQRKIGHEGYVMDGCI